MIMNSKKDGKEFWQEKAKELYWQKPFTEVLSGSLEKGDVTWFKDGLINVCENCVDRHLEQHSEKTAILWQGDQPEHQQQLTFYQLHLEVCRFANILKKYGIRKGDRICLYMPMIIEAPIAMLACARIGAIHSVVFSGFSPASLKSRIEDAKAIMVITADSDSRGGKIIQYKENVDKALVDNQSVRHVLVVNRLKEIGNLTKGRDLLYSEELKHVDDHCAAEPMKSTDPLFILYTSGSTGQPKGVVHSAGGYLTYAAHTHREVFEINDHDIYWCTADIGWITGHTYVVYGPLANATTTLLFEGVPTYPDASRCWQIIDKHQVSVFYTAPTAIRSLMAAGDQYLESSTRDSLRILGTVGEPINPEAWAWYNESVGKNKCLIMDTWWQTETGGILMAPPHNKDAQKPGATMRPLPHIKPAIMDEKGQEIKEQGEGALVIKEPWPGLMQTIFGDHQRFIDLYLKPFPGYYYSGDAALRDQDGDIWIKGRLDDVLNVSGHRLGTAEIESALITHPSVAEAAVVGVEDPIKGEGIYAYIVLLSELTPSEELKKDLNQVVRKEIGPIASLDHVAWAPDLPKTRSGKIMRRILRKVANHDDKNLGDLSTLANPECVDLLKNNKNQS